MPDARSEHMNAAALPTSSIVTFFFSGAASEALLNIDLKLLMPAEAKVLIGPAEMALTRVPSGPNAAAIYRTLASRLALATPMIL